jgi:hypothetical protein
MWGALSGVAVSLVPAAMVAVGLADTHISLWRITGVLVGPLAVFSAASAAASLALARRAARGGDLLGAPGVSALPVPMNIITDPRACGKSPGRVHISRSFCTRELR